MTDRPLIVLPDGSTRPFNDAEYAQWLIDSQPRAPEPPDGPTLGDWRTALVLWGRLDAIDAAIAVLKQDADPGKAMLGKVAEQRFQFSNNVYRQQLTLFKDLLGFSIADVDESLWRADRVAQGDMSGQWPLP